MIISYFNEIGNFGWRLKDNLFIYSNGFLIFIFLDGNIFFEE